MRKNIAITFIKGVLLLGVMTALTACASKNVSITRQITSPTVTGIYWMD